MTSAPPWRFGKRYNLGSRTLRDYQTRVVAFRDAVTGKCYLEKMNLKDGNEMDGVTKVIEEIPGIHRLGFFETTHVESYNSIETWQLAGPRIHTFCEELPVIVINKSKEDKRQFDSNNIPIYQKNSNFDGFASISGEPATVYRVPVGKPKRKYITRADSHQPEILRKRYTKQKIIETSNTPSPRSEYEGKWSSNANSKRHWLSRHHRRSLHPRKNLQRSRSTRSLQPNNVYPKGRYRGQTQSQYLNFGIEGSEPGKAEAESSFEGSRAIVSGRNGMGSAQSQTSYGSGCEDCYGAGQLQGQVLGYNPDRSTIGINKPDLEKPTSQEPGDYFKTGGSQRPGGQNGIDRGPIGPVQKEYPSSFGRPGQTTNLPTYEGIIPIDGQQPSDINKYPDQTTISRDHLSPTVNNRGPGHYPITQNQRYPVYDSINTQNKNDPQNQGQRPGNLFPDINGPVQASKVIYSDIPGRIPTNSQFSNQKPDLGTGTRPDGYPAESGQIPLPQGQNIVHGKNGVQVGPSELGSRNRGQEGIPGSQIITNFPDGRGTFPGISGTDSGFTRPPSNLDQNLLQTPGQHLKYPDSVDPINFQFPHHTEQGKLDSANQNQGTPYPNLGYQYPSTLVQGGRYPVENGKHQVFIGKTPIQTGQFPGYIGQPPISEQTGQLPDQRESTIRQPGQYPTDAVQYPNQNSNHPSITNNYPAKPSNYPDLVQSHSNKNGHSPGNIEIYPSQTYQYPGQSGSIYDHNERSPPQSVQYPDQSGIFTNQLQPPGQYPSQGGQHPASNQDQNGRYPSINGQYPVESGRQPNQNGHFPNQNGQQGYQNGQYTRPAEKYPSQIGQYPVSNVLTPDNRDQTGGYPEKNGQYPKQNLPSPEQGVQYPGQNKQHPGQINPQQPTQNSVFPGHPQQSPNQNGQFPGQPGINADKIGQYPNQGGQYPVHTGKLPGDTNVYYPGQNGQSSNQNSQFPVQIGQYPGQPLTQNGKSGQYPSPSGQYPGIFPDQYGQYPTQNRQNYGQSEQYPAQYPGQNIPTQNEQLPSQIGQTNITYPGQNGLYPTQNGQYPVQTGRYPDGLSNNFPGHVGQTPSQNGNYPVQISQYPNQIGRHPPQSVQNGFVIAGQPSQGGFKDGQSEINKYPLETLDTSQGAQNQGQQNFGHEINNKDTIGGIKKINSAQSGNLLPGGLEEEEQNAQAQTNVQQIHNETQLSASAQGIYGKGKTQTQVSGTYSGGASFSAQAQTSDSDKGAQSQISAGKDKASGSAQGNAGKNTAQVQVNLNRETGATAAESQSLGWQHGSNSQVKVGTKGGLADAQANGPGGTSSQAQIGFIPHQENSNITVQNIVHPYTGSGSASAQAGRLSGQSQSQIQGKIHYGISYSGAAQAGSGVKDGNFTMKPLDLFDNNNQDIKIDEIPKVTSDNKNTDVNKSIEINKKSESFAKHTDQNNSTRHGADKVTKTTADEYDIEDNDEDYEEYENSKEVSHQALLDDLSNTNTIIEQTSSGQKQHIILGPLGKNDAQIIQDTSKKGQLTEGMIFQPGDVIPGTQGYTIPIGFRGRVSSVSHGDETFAIGDEEHNSQAQTVTITPGTGNISLSKPNKNNVTLRSGRISKNYVVTRPNHFINRLNLRSGNENNGPPSYISVTNSVAGKINNGKNNPSQDRQYSHTYYTKSSTCGYFTFSCDVVYGTNGRTKVCKPKLPMNPDGTPMEC